MYVSIHTHMHTFNVCMHVSMYAYKHMDMNSGELNAAYLYTNISTCVYIHTCVHIYIYTYKYIHIHIHIYTYVLLFAM